MIATSLASATAVSGFRSRTRLWGTAQVALLVALVAASGCNEEACHDEVASCDIRDATCQRQVMAAVSCLRGGDTKLPPVTVVSQDELAMRFSQRSERTAAEEAAADRVQRGFALFDLGPGHYGAEQSAQDFAAGVGAVYFPDTKDIVVVDRGQPLDDSSAVEIFAHELTHALQDADYDLKAYYQRWATTFDSSVAADAVIEGEAVLYQLLIDLKLRGLNPHEVDWEGYFFGWRAQTLTEAEQDEVPIEMADLRFPYAFGGGLVAQYWLAGGRSAIDALVDHPPLSTREVMFGLAPEPVRDSYADLAEHAVPVLGPDYVLSQATSLGAWVARIYAARTGVPVYDRFDAAAGVLSDVFVVQTDLKRDVVTASWRIRLDEALPPSTWPALAPNVTSWDAKRGEVFQLASEVEIGDEGELAWTSIAADGDAQGGASAAAVSALRRVDRGRRLGCRVNRPMPGPATIEERAGDSHAEQ